MIYAARPILFLIIELARLRFEFEIPDNSDYVSGHWVVSLLFIIFRLTCRQYLSVLRTVEYPVTAGKYGWNSLLCKSQKDRN